MIRRIICTSVLVLHVVLVLLQATNGAGSVVSYSSFTPSILSSDFQSNIMFSSVAPTVIDNDYVHLLDGSASQQATSIQYNTPMDITQFDTTFQIQFRQGVTGSNIREGMTFIIHNDPRGTASIGWVDGFLGARGPNVITSSFAVAFNVDTFYGPRGFNYWLPNDVNVYSNNYVGISPVDLASQHIMQVHLTYDGTTLQMTIVDTVTNQVYTAPSYTVNIPSIVGSNTAYLGFTAASSGSVGALNVDIHQWNFASLGVNGDPQFTGFQGQQYQVHGIPDSWFNLISTPQLHLNGRFAYIASGSCTYNNTMCWSHPGTYVDDIGMTIDISTNRTVRIRVTSGPHADGIRLVSIDGKSLTVGNKYGVGHTFMIHFKSQDTLLITTSLFRLEFVNSDYFFNINTAIRNRRIIADGAAHHHITYGDDVNNKYPAHPIHGLIGQSWRNCEYIGYDGRHHAYEGVVDDYVTDGPFDIDSTYAQH